MWHKLKRVLVLIVGWAFVLLGAVGLFLPVLQGILFILIGLLILSSEYRWARSALTKLRVRFPGLAERLEEASTHAGNWLRRIAGRGRVADNNQPNSRGEHTSFGPARRRG